MDLTSPAAAALPVLRARVLMVLARAEAGLTGRKVASLAERSVAGVAKVLEALVASGLVHRVDAGSASLYTLNRAHLAAPAIELLAQMRAQLFSRMGASIADFTHPPLSAILFGSAARGDGDEKSDIDLLLVRPPTVDEDDEAWAADVERLGADVLAWTGNALHVVEYDPHEVAADAPGRAFLAEVEAEGVPLYGTDLRTVRRGVRTVKR
jgi:predicted nucleotidyltransferase